MTLLGWFNTRSVTKNLAYTFSGHGRFGWEVQLFLKESYVISGSTFVVGSRSVEAQKSAGNFENWETEKEALMSYCPLWEYFIECC